MRLTRGNPFAAGLVLLGIVLAVLLAAIAINLNFGLPANLNLGWPPGFDYNLSATFTDANGLARGADVVIAGTPVGQVTNVQAAGTQAVATMRIDRNYAPVHQGTIARIRYSTLLAQKYVELTPSTNGRTIQSGARIPSSSTITPVDFDQFLSTLDPQTRQQLQVIVQQAGGGVQGRQEAINSLLDNLGNLAVESKPGLAVINNHDADLANITTNLDITSQRLAQSRDNLGGFIQNTGTVEGTLAANDKDLSGLIYHLANDMNDFDTTLNGEEGNFHDTVTTFDPFLVQLNGTLSYVYPYVHNNLGPLETGLNTLIPYIGSAINEQDANGNYLRQFLVNDCRYDSIQQPGQPSACPAAPAAPAASSSNGPAAPGASAPSAPAPKITICPTIPPAPKLPTPPPPPTPVPTLSPCPTPNPPCIPIPGVPTPTPRPTASPGTCIPVQGNPLNPPGSIPVLPAPIPSLPGVVTGLATGGL
jgi:virulence factor Mce-like protein